MMRHLSTGGRTGNAGSSTDYCRYDTFVNPVDIRPITFALSGFNVTPDNVPTTGLDTDEVKRASSRWPPASSSTVLGAPVTDWHSLSRTTFRTNGL